MPKRTHRQDFAANGGRFLAPDEVGSAINWRMTVKTSLDENGDVDWCSLDANLALSDCNKWIRWEFDSYGFDDGDDDKEQTGTEALAKIDAAIKELQNFRASLILAYKVRAKMKKQIKPKAETKSVSA